MGAIKHHLNDELLMGYAAGILPEAFDLIVATHVSLCDECRARLAAFEEVGGAMLEEADSEIAVADDALERALSLIAQSPELDAPRRAKGNAVFPLPLQEYVGGDVDAVDWRPVGMGVCQSVLNTSRDARVRLLKIPAGCAMPDHGHRGTELTLVLQGAFEDDGEVFSRGDVEVAGEETAHTPVAAPGADCICLAATDAPLRFTKLLPRVLQPFLRI
jgi:putative transcriptional regulator